MNERWYILKNHTGKYRLRNTETGEWYQENCPNPLQLTLFKIVEFNSLEEAEAKRKEITWTIVA